MTAVHVYATVGLEEDAILDESLPLFRKDGREAPSTVDNTVAGKMHVLRYTTKPKAYLTGMMGTAGQGSYLTVSEHTPGGYLPDNIVDSLHKLPSLVCFCVALTRSSFLSCTFCICSSSEPRVMKR